MPRSKRPPKPPPARTHILVVDDDVPIQELIRDVLESDGYEVEVGAGPRGLAMARARPPALILLDMMMPDMDGAELAGKLRADPDLADTPFVIMTAYAHPDKWYTTIGAADYLKKPFSINVLSKVVAALVPPPDTQGGIS